MAKACFSTSVLLYCLALNISHASGDALEDFHTSNMLRDLNERNDRRAQEREKNATLREPGPNAKWEQVARNLHGNKYYIDRASIGRSGHSVKLWVLIDRPDTDKNGALSYKNLYEFDCAAEEFRSLFWSNYSGNMGSNLIAGNYDDQKWGEITIGPAALIKEAVCPRPATAGSPDRKSSSGETASNENNREFSLRWTVVDYFSGTDLVALGWDTFTEPKHAMIWKDMRRIKGKVLLTCTYWGGWQARYWYRQVPEGANPKELAARIPNHPLLNIPPIPREDCPARYEDLAQAK